MTARKPQCCTCKLAEWERTKSGRLHPNGRGECTWDFPKVVLPISMYWDSSRFKPSGPAPSGGRIRRRDEWRQCPRYQPEDEK